jgi:hypothetical protein
MLELDLDRFAPFRLIAVEPVATPWPTILEFAWDRDQLSIVPHSRGPICLVSSGLGDSEVAPRLDLFSSWFGPDPMPERQAEFHRHSWSNRPEISVMMRRPEARTVSITTLRVEASGVRAKIQWEYLSVPG